MFLEFLNMGWQDIGDYKCVAENELGTAEKSVKIDVAGTRPFPRWGRYACSALALRDFTDWCGTGESLVTLFYVSDSCLACFVTGFSAAMPLTSFRITALLTSFRIALI